MNERMCEMNERNSSIEHLLEGDSKAVKGVTIISVRLLCAES